MSTSHDDDHDHDRDHGGVAPAGSVEASSDSPPRDVFRIQGMDCAEEIAVLKRELGPLVGGEEHLGFDVLNGKMLVRASAKAVSVAEIERAVAVTGMTASPWISEKGGRPARRDARTLPVMLSGVGTLVGFAIHVWAAGGPLGALGSEGMGIAAGPPILARVAYATAIVAGLWLVFPKALFALRRLRPDMNLLMVIAVAGALAIDEWFEAATVTLLFSVSLALESWSVARARRAVESLAAMAPTRARVRRGGIDEEIAPEDVAVGDAVVVRAGERFAVDGEVLEGSGDVNQAPITGESVPVAKAPGSEVFAGAINGDAVLVVRATKPAGESMLARIASLVADAQSRRGPSEQWVERFAAWYTPAILASSALIACVPPLLSGAEWQPWVYRALVLLVIGCPCSLVISTPVSIVAAIASAARHGVLVKGGRFIEIPATLRAIALDKTGTLTEGRPRVVEVVPLAEHDERELLERAFALEARSTHPLARAIVEHSRAQGITAAPAEAVEIIPGKGATALFGGKPYWLGSHRYLEERGQESSALHERLAELEVTGCSVVVIGNDEHVCGLIALRDGIREESVRAIRALREAGVSHVAMLTGDNPGTAAIVAKETDVDTVLAQLLPADKVTAIEKLVESHGAVAMVGDGVNDAPALARATLGIAMGAAGSDVALETADVALMNDDLGKVAWLVQHSRRALTIIRQNIAFSLVTKAVFVVLALAGVSSLWLAIAADMGASLLVTLNGLRLLSDPRSAP
ncbi:MAG: cadmium-translocating P-type ATPase [Deltaproteobacteria bacterium]|nr:cadmium-translocating P-type ATPase [Deltaproteobacteria bacterium]